MADKKESALGAVTDFAQARVLDASGASKNIDKATLASVLADAMTNLAWVNIETIEVGGTTNQFTSLKNVFENAWTVGEDYRLFESSSGAGAEGGLIMFKHSSSAVSYGIMFNKYKGVLMVKRDTNGTWWVKEILGMTV